MRSVCALALVSSACLGGPSADDVGPRHGPWQVDAAERWFCTGGGVVCAPPAYFSPPPDQVEIRAGGVLRWTNGVAHSGAVEPACIRVAAATESGVARTETTFCNLIDAGVINEVRAFAIIGWSPGTATECTCSAHVDYTGDE